MSAAYTQALEALELVARVPEVRGGVFVLDQQDMDFVREAAESLTKAATTSKFWCDTCEGSGSVHQEHQAGCWVGGDFPCPDCDGKGYWMRHTPSHKEAP